MKRRACPWCVRAACSCGWTGYRSKDQRDPYPCPKCWGWPGGTKPRNREVHHRMSTVCHFIPAAELIKLKE